MPLIITYHNHAGDDTTDDDHQDGEDVDDGDCGGDSGDGGHHWQWRWRLAGGANHSPIHWDDPYRVGAGLEKPLCLSKNGRHILRLNGVAVPGPSNSCARRI